MFLGLAFLVIGIEKLTGTMGTIPFFAAIGWGQWFRHVSGVLDTAGALLIFFPRWTCYGALIVTCRQMLVVVQLPDLKVKRLPPHWQIDFGHLKA